MYNCMREHVFNDDMAEVLFPDALSDPSALPLAVIRAKARNGWGQWQARRMYLRKMLGEVDGYEEYCVAAHIIETHAAGSMPQEVESLRETLSSFTNCTPGRHPASLTFPRWRECCTKLHWARAGLHDCDELSVPRDP